MLTCFAGFPYHDIEPGMTWYYMLQSAYNIDAFVSLLELSLRLRFQPIRAPNMSAEGAITKSWQWPVRIEWSPTVRGDFTEMAVHHVVTNLLVIGSSQMRFTRIGSMVFLLHDISDVPVDVSKLANFVKWKVTTVASFTVMTLTWAYTRLYLFPGKIFAGVWYDSHYVLQEGLPPILYVCYRHFFYVLLGLLVLLHAAWFVMFLQMYHKFATTSQVHDLSEHKQGESYYHKEDASGTKVTNGHGIEINGHSKLTNGTSKKKK
jgi:hypothetical protein